MRLPANEDVVQQVPPIATGWGDQHQLAFMKEDIVKGITSVEIASVGRYDKRCIPADSADAAAQIALAIAEHQVLPVRRMQFPLLEQLPDVFVPLVRRTFLQVAHHLQFDFLGGYEHRQRIGTDVHGGNVVLHGIGRVVGQIEAGLCRGWIGQQHDNIGMAGEITNVAWSRTCVRCAEAL